MRVAEIEEGIEAREGWGFEQGDEIVPGRYALRLLGGGRRYEAYLAHDEALLTTVVVKILRPHRMREPEVLAGLAAEFRMLQALNHPVIARGYDAVLDGPRPHLALEFLEGPRLSTLLRKHGALPMEQLIPLATHINSALHYMHGERFVHLDVKPQNIIMGAPPKLIDMSIARTIEDAARLTSGVGTDSYMAPEQCLAVPGTVERAADIYGFGITLYEAAVGHLPFPKPADGSRHPQLEMEPEGFDRDFPAPVASLISDCLQRDPDLRPTTREIAERLDPLIAALPRRIVLGRMRPRWK